MCPPGPGLAPWRACPGLCVLPLSTLLRRRNCAQCFSTGITSFSVPWGHPHPPVSAASFVFMFLFGLCIWGSLHHQLLQVCGASGENTVNSTLPLTQAGRRRKKDPSPPLGMDKNHWLLAFWGERRVFRSEGEVGGASGLTPLIPHCHPRPCRPGSPEPGRCWQPPLMSELHPHLPGAETNLCPQAEPQALSFTFPFRLLGVSLH